MLLGGAKDEHFSYFLSSCQLGLTFYFVFTFCLFCFYFIFIRDRRPLSARGSNNSDSIEDYIRNWKKNDSGTSPLHSPGIESVK